jgi:hypothetical protein
MVRGVYSNNPEEVFQATQKFRKLLSIGEFSTAYQPKAQRGAQPRSPPVARPFRALPSQRAPLAPLC